MPGLESDARAGAVRVGDIVAKPADLSPAVQQLSDGFRKGFITTQDILDRYSARAQEEEKAGTEVARVQKETAQQITPDIIQKRAAVERGSLEEQINQQNLAAQTRDQRNKLATAQIAQALDEITGGLPAAQVRQLQIQYPFLDAKFDENGVVVNSDEVKKKIPLIKSMLDFQDSVSNFEKQTKQVKVTLPGGVEGEQTVWAATGQPVPPNILQMITKAKEARAVGLNITPGTFSGPTTPATAPAAAAPAAAAPAAAAPAAAVPGATTDTGAPAAGTVTQEGVFVTGPSQQARGPKPTEIESRANKFARRMELAGTQYEEAIKNGFDPANPNNQTLMQAAAAADKVPILGPQLSRFFPADAYRVNASEAAFISSVLRDESGAAVTDKEKADYARVFFPVAGDPPDVSQNKAAIRLTALAALRQVASGQLSDEQFEREIETLTGRQFPAATSVRNPKDLGSGVGQQSTVAPGSKTAPAPTPSNIVRLKPGQRPPPGAQFIWIEGEPGPRRLVPKG